MSVCLSLRNYSHIEVKGMKAPHKIGLPPGMRVLYMERHEKEYDTAPEYIENCSKGLIRRDGHYRIWIHTSDRVFGTYLALWDDGKIERITVRKGEGDQIDLIKPAD
jgi:hypothetical protein